MALMERQLSTSLSDFILGSSAVWSFMSLQNSSLDYQYGKWWFMLEAIAASLGVLNFGSHEEFIDKYHKKFSWLSMAIGIPCLGAQFCLIHEAILLSQVFLMVAVINFVVCSKKVELKEVLPTVTSTLIFIYLLYIGIKSKNFYLCYTVVLFLLSAFMGDEGVTSFGIPRVDLFHYILTIANIFTVWAMTVSL